MASPTTPTILILGASYVGLATTHRLLRLLPAEYKVVLVNPSDHLYWNVATPRGIAKNSQFTIDNQALFQPFLPGFSAQPESRFEFVLGTATALDPAASSATISTPSGSARTIAYTHLVIATGASAHGAWPFKQLGSRAETEAALKTANERIEVAKTIVLSGAGPTGVETAGEIATLWKGAGKKIVLVDAGAGPLPMLREDVRKTAQKQLQSLGVEVRSNVRVVKESNVDGGLRLELSSGETITADLHIPTYGLVPNTGFVPAHLLDETKSVKISKHMRSTEIANIWAAGDAAGVKSKTLINSGPMMEAMVTNLVAVLGGKEPSKEFTDPETLMMVPIGGGFAMGTGIMFGWKPWGFVVWLAKGRNFFITNAPKVALGQALPAGGKP